ncbi:MAG: hypothetical protein PHV95_06105 [Eubacteriales bacterium]|nr:hypothetical protein [Eubacteriales bacterium]
MKKYYFIFLSLLITFVFPFIGVTAAEINRPDKPTFYDDFTDETKSVAKSENVIYESVDPQFDTAYITRSDTKSGYIIWKLDDLLYTNLSVVIYNGLDIDILDAVSLEASFDGENWSELEIEASSEGGSEWISYRITAYVKEPVKYVKVNLFDTGNAAWSVKIGNLALYNKADAPSIPDTSGTPNTGESSNEFFMLTISLLVASFTALAKRSYKHRIKYKTLSI